MRAKIDAAWVWFWETPACAPLFFIAFFELLRLWEVIHLKLIESTPRWNGDLVLALAWILTLLAGAASILTVGMIGARIGLRREAKGLPTIHLLARPAKGARYYN